MFQKFQMNQRYLMYLIQKCLKYHSIHANPKVLMNH
jgi:hypothetical protein